MDGAHICRENKRVFFHKISDPGDQDIAELLESIIEAVELCLRKRGLLDEQEESENPEDLLSIEAASRASPCEINGRGRGFVSIVLQVTISPRVFTRLMNTWPNRRKGRPGNRTAT
jgi:hypothetical protein